MMVGSADRLGRAVAAAAACWALLRDGFAKRSIR